jgi:tetratricopeptide (TPR) repeat protein
MVTSSSSSSSSNYSSDEDKLSTLTLPYNYYANISIIKEGLPQLKEIVGNGLGEFPKEAELLWLSIAEAAIERKDRTAIVLLIQLLEKVPPKDITPILQVYKHYCLGILATIETNWEKMLDHFTFGHILLVECGLDTEQYFDLKICLEINIANALSFANFLEEAELRLAEIFVSIRNRNLSRLEIKATIVSIKLYYCKGDIKSALELGQKGLKLARQHEDRASLAKILQLMGICNVIQNSFQEAIQAFEEAIAISKVLSDNAELGTLYNNMAVAYDKMQRYQQALEVYELALTLCDQRADKPNIVTALNNIGWTNQRLGRYNEAQQAFEKGVQLAREVGEPSFTFLIVSRYINFLTEMGEVKVVPGYLDEAQALFDKNAPQMRWDHLAEGCSYLSQSLLRMAGTSTATATELEKALVYYARTHELYEQKGDNEALVSLDNELVALLMDLYERGYIFSSTEQEVTNRIVVSWWQRMEQASKRKRLELFNQANRCAHYLASTRGQQTRTETENNLKLAAKIYRTILLEAVSDAQIVPEAKIEKQFVKAATALGGGYGVALLEEGLRWSKKGLFKLSNSKEYTETLKLLRSKVGN